MSIDNQPQPSALAGEAVRKKRRRIAAESKAKISIPLIKEPAPFQKDCPPQEKRRPPLSGVFRPGRDHSFAATLIYHKPIWMSSPTCPNYTSRVTPLGCKLELWGSFKSVKVKSEVNNVGP